MIHLDTSVLVDALAGARGGAGAVREAIAGGERIEVASLVLFEWLRGPRRTEELEALDALFPAQAAVAFGAAEAAVAAGLYRVVRRPRGREIDLAIAACALTRGAALWTLNPDDFGDIPDLRLFVPAGAR